MGAKGFWYLFQRGVDRHIMTLDVLGMSLSAWQHGVSIPINNSVSILRSRATNSLILNYHSLSCILYIEKSVDIPKENTDFGFPVHEVPWQRIWAREDRVPSRRLGRAPKVLIFTTSHVRTVLRFEQVCRRFGEWRKV